MPEGVVFYPLNSAFYVVDRAFMADSAGAPGRIVITTTWAVIKHPSGVVIFDTGVDPAAIDGRPTSEDAAFETGDPIMGSGNEVEARLKSIGLAVSDVQYVISSHLHVDHVGGNRDLEHATFLAQRSEVDYALSPDPHMASEYRPELICLDRLRYESPEGRSLDVFGDGTVEILPTPGHTPGHQSLFVRTKSHGPVILTGDAIWTADCLKRGVLPGLLWDERIYEDSRRKLLERRDRESARLFHSHDPHTFTDLGWVEGKAYG